MAATHFVAKQYDVNSTKCIPRSWLRLVPKNADHLVQQMWNQACEAAGIEVTPGLKFFTRMLRAHMKKDIEDKIECLVSKQAEFWKKSAMNNAGKIFDKFFDENFKKVTCDNYKTYKNDETMNKWLDLQKYIPQADVVLKQKEIDLLRPKVFLDVNANDAHIGRILIELRFDVVPNAAFNFYALCVGKRSPSGRILHFKGSKFHRIEQFLIEGGDINGNGGESIYGTSFHADNFQLNHNEKMLICMKPIAEYDPNSKFNSQFVIFPEIFPQANNFAVIGKVVEGSKTIQGMQKSGGDGSDDEYEYIIANCGAL